METLMGAATAHTEVLEDGGGSGCVHVVIDGRGDNSTSVINKFKICTNTRLMVSYHNGKERTVTGKKYNVDCCSKHNANLECC